MANRDAISSSSNVDTSPLLQGISREDEEEPITNRPSSPRRGRLSRLIRLMSGTGASARNTGRGIMREPSVLVRETAAEHLEERQSDWAYSKPIVILDLIWNLSFVIVAIVVLILSRIERPSNPLRLWIAVYAAQCCVHIACVCLEYRRRQQRSINTSTSSAGAATTTTTPTTTTTNTNGNASQRAQEQVGLSYAERAPRISESDDGDETFDEFRSTRIRLVKRIESANTSFSFVWWIIGFYWTTTGTQSHDAPLLFWLCVGFLAFDVFFVVFCVSLACIIGIAVCCCLPCIIAIMYAVAEQEGASEEDIDLLPKYKFRQSGSYMNTGDVMRSSGGVMSPVDSTSGAPAERVLSAEDALFTSSCPKSSNYIEFDTTHPQP